MRIVPQYLLLILCACMLFQNVHATGNTTAKKAVVKTKVSKPVIPNPTAREQEVNDKDNPDPAGASPDLHRQTEPPVGKNYIEKWLITSARTTDSGTVDREYMLSPSSYFIFVTGKKVLVRLNEFFPEQEGEFNQSVLFIHIKLKKDPACTQCVDEMMITRKSEQDKEYLLEFNGMQQLFSINKK